MDLLYEGRSAGRLCISAQFDGDYGMGNMGLGEKPYGMGVGVGGMKKEF
jgi:hypothetical protein